MKQWFNIENVVTCSILGLKCKKLYVCPYRDLAQALGRIDRVSISPAQMPNTIDKGCCGIAFTDLAV